MNPKNSAAYSEHYESFASWRLMAAILLLNMLACWMGYLILGGSSLLAETHEGESYLRPLHGDEFQVSNAVGMYSFLHEVSVILTLPNLAFSLLAMLYRWVQIRIVLKRITPNATKPLRLSPNT